MESSPAEREAPHGRGRPGLHPVLTGAGLIFVHGLFGAFLSAFLTALKFRSSYSCDVALLSSCQIGSAFNCENVLSSPWSTFPGAVPISIYATSFFLVIVGLAGSILLWPRSFAPAGRALLLALAWCSIAVIVPLFIYALFLGVCSYCFVVYLICIAVLLAAHIMNPRGWRSALAALRDGSTYRRTSTLLITSLTFVAFTMVQVVWFLQARASVEAEEQCVSETGELPETDFSIGSDSPEVDIALFVDLSCSVCRREYATWKQDVAASNGKYRLKLFHFPLDGDCINGRLQSSPRSHKNHSCNAARAVQCIEGKQKGLGLAFVDELFARQDETPPFFSLEQLAAAANEVGFHVNAADPENSFYQCIEDDGAQSDGKKANKEAREALTRVRSHVRFAVDEGFRETPAVFLVFYDEEGAPLTHAYKLAGDKNYANVDEYIDSARELAMKRAVGGDDIGE